MFLYVELEVTLTSHLCVTSQLINGQSLMSQVSLSLSLSQSQDHRPSDLPHRHQHKYTNHMFRGVNYLSVNDLD